MELSPMNFQSHKNQHLHYFQKGQYSSIMKLKSQKLIYQTQIKVYFKVSQKNIRHNLIKIKLRTQMTRILLHTPSSKLLNSMLNSKLEWPKLSNDKRWLMPK